MYHVSHYGKINFIQVDSVCLFYKSWYTKGVTVVNDLLENDGTFLTLNSFKLKYGIQVNFLQYYGICEAIKSGYNKQKTFCKMEEPLRLDMISLICKFQKGCSHIYSLFQLNDKKRN